MKRKAGGKKDMAHRSKNFEELEIGTEIFALKSNLSGPKFVRVSETKYRRVQKNPFGTWELVEGTQNISQPGLDFDVYVFVTLNKP